jgi:predicted DNA-binding ribbon-helix-helix protein
MLKKRSLQQAGHPTSQALEPEFWLMLEAMAQARAISLTALVQSLDEERGQAPLASACRVAALNFARRLSQAT